MIELNLLKEGHGVLYERVTHWYSSSSFKLLLLILLSACLYKVTIKNSSDFLMAYMKINDFYKTVILHETPKELFEPKKEKVIYTKEVKKAEPFTKDENVEALKTQTNHPVLVSSKTKLKSEAILKNKEPFKEKENIINQSEVFVEKETVLKVEKEKDATENIIKDLKEKNIVVKDLKKRTVFKIIAGTCLLKTSADSIYSQLKKQGFSESFIKKSKINVNYYSVLIGNFYSLEEIDSIRKKINKKIEIEVVEANEKYVVKTHSVIKLKYAKKTLKFLEKIGINGKVLKTKEKKDGFVIVVKKFDKYSEAYSFIKKLKKKGIQSSILKNVIEF